MKFDQTATLIGVVGKKGTGTLDSGQQWTTDRVELHVDTPFSESDSMAHGSTVTVYQVQDFAANYEKAKSCLHQEIVLHMTMEPAKKLGAAPKFICTGFSSTAVKTTSVPSEPAARIPAGVSKASA